MLTRLAGAGALSHHGSEVGLTGAAIVGAVEPVASGLYSGIFNSWLLGQYPLLKEMLG